MMILKTVQMKSKTTYTTFIYSFFGCPRGSPTTVTLTVITDAVVPFSHVVIGCILLILLKRKCFLSVKANILIANFQYFPVKCYTIKNLNFHDSL